MTPSNTVAPTDVEQTDVEQTGVDSEEQHLVVVGAAAGIGRWLCDHVFALKAVRSRWASVTLLDTPEAIGKLTSTSSLSDVAIFAEVSADGPSRHIALSHPRTVAVLAVPLDTLTQVQHWLTNRLHADAVLIDTSHDRSRSTKIWGDRRTTGLHQSCRPHRRSAPIPE